MQYTLNIKGRLLSLDVPQVMGILNVTPDSFFAGSRAETAELIAQRTRKMVAEGATIIDVGACSTRPGSQPASAKEEMERLRMALPIVRREAPETAISVDTFRADVARMVVEELDADIINDVEEGRDAEMFRTVARLRTPYILMSTRATINDMMTDFAKEVQQLRDLGQKDIVLDPGFGFGKTLEQNYDVMRQLKFLGEMGLPVLVGVSRKSMIHRLLNITPAEALNGTTALNMLALANGASILRVHDVRAAMECIKINQALKLCSSNLE